MPKTSIKMVKLFNSQGGFIKVHSTSLAEPRPLIQLTNTSINVQLNGLHLEAVQLTSSCMKLPKNVLGRLLEISGLFCFNFG